MIERFRSLLAKRWREWPGADDAINTRKRNSYLLVLPAGAAFAAFDAIQQRLYGTGNPFNFWTDICLAVSLIMLTLALWRWPHHQRLAEFGIFLLTAAFILANFFVDLHSAPSPQLAGNPTTVILKWAQWLEVVYLIGFFTFDAKESLALSALVFLAGIVIGLSYLFPLWLSGQFSSGLYLLIQFFIAGAITLLFLYQVGSLRQRYALTDFLTGVANRRQMYQSLAHELDRAQRYGQGFSIILCDLDRFKKIKDTHGHLSGDFVLKSSAQVLLSSLRGADYMCRWGGEEFLIALPMTERAGAIQVAERLRQTIAEHAFDHLRHVTVSLGVAAYREGDTLEALLHRSDRALYQAKHNGRNQVAVEELEGDSEL